MRILRGVGWVLLLAGATLLARDLMAALAGEGELRLSALGDIWFAIHPDSLQLLQPAIERHVSPVLWDPFILTLLTWPAAIEAIVLGGIFLLVGRRRGRR